MPLHTACGINKTGQRVSVFNVFLCVISFNTREILSVGNLACFFFVVNS